MQFAAQVQACIELIEAQLNDNQVSDRSLNRYFRARRYIGSKDRNAIATLFYAVLRERLLLEYALDQLGVQPNAAHILAVYFVRLGTPISTIFTDERYQPAKLDAGVADALNQLHDFDWNSVPNHVQLNTPEWLYQLFCDTFGDQQAQIELQALNTEAPVDLRVNTLKGDLSSCQAILKESGISATQTTMSPIGLRLEQRVPVTGLDAFKNGLFEVQDQGSQLLALCTQAQPGQRVIDFCAGAGGKSLALSALMDNKGSIVACDVSGPRLAELSKRAKRAGAFNIRTLEMTSERDKKLKRHASSADVVLVDAPCSGTGAWRRNPDARFNLSAERLAQLLEMQTAILESAARLVRPGGLLVYATCSLLQQENQHQVDKFLNKNNGLYSLIDLNNEAFADYFDNPAPLAHHYFNATPAQTDTDGFFAAVLKRKEEPKDD